MLSYEERLETFAGWPEEYLGAFVKHLAIIGQYSVDETALTTVCVYCQKRLEDWKIDDDPLLEHHKHNGECPIYRLYTVAGRKQVLEMNSNIKNKRELGSLASRSFTQMNIKKDRPFIFCIGCGSTNKNHKCKTPVPKNQSRQWTHNHRFYVKLLRGKIQEEIGLYLEGKLEIPEKHEESIKSLLELVPDRCSYDSIEDVLKRGIEEALKELEGQLISMEKNVINELESDSTATFSGANYKE